MPFTVWMPWDILLDSLQAVPEEIRTLIFIYHYEKTN